MLDPGQLVVRGRGHADGQVLRIEMALPSVDGDVRLPGRLAHTASRLFGFCLLHGAAPNPTDYRRLGLSMPHRLTQAGILSPGFDVSYAKAGEGT